MRLIFFLVISFALNLSALAGSRNGYRLVFFDASPVKAAETVKIFSDYFNAELSPSIYRCDTKNRFIDVDIVYIHQLPKAITPKLIRNSIESDRNALERLRTGLRAFRNSEIDHGFDGLVAFRGDGSFFELITISAVPNGYKKTAKVGNNNGRLTPAVLKDLFCESTAELDFAYQNE